MPTSLNVRILRHDCDYDCADHFYDDIDDSDATYDADDDHITKISTIRTISKPNTHGNLDE